MPSYRQKTSVGWVAVGYGDRRRDETSRMFRGGPQRTSSGKWKPCPECSGAMAAESKSPRCRVCEERIARVERRRQRRRAEILRRFLATPAKLLAKGRLAELDPMERAIMNYARRRAAS